MWYCRFGEHSVSLEDQRRIQMRTKQEMQLRRAVLVARKEVVLQQRCQRKEKRYDRFLKLKESCLNIKITDRPGGAFAPARRTRSKSAKRAKTPRKDASLPRPELLSTKQPTSSDSEQKKKGSAEKPKKPPPFYPSSAFASFTETKAPGKQEDRLMLSASSARNVLSSSRASSPNQSRARTGSTSDVQKLLGAIASTSKRSARSPKNEVGGIAGQGRSFVERVALELRSVKSPSKRGQLDDEATEKLLKELASKVRDASVEIERGGKPGFASSASSSKQNSARNRARYYNEKCPHPRTWENLYCKPFQMKHSPSCIYQHHRFPIVNSKNVLYCKRPQQERRLSCKRCDTRL
ncbi:unnamed protein product, partial [Amoebophrya sp. A120]|eukprot:GSA120T00020208001.1